MKQFSIIILCALLSAISNHAPAQPLANTIKVSYNKTTMLILPANIIDADRGSSTIAVKVNKKTPTVLKVKAGEVNFLPTNVTVYTDDKRMYTINVQFDSLAPATPYRFSFANESFDISEHAAPTSTISDAEIRIMADSVSSMTHGHYHISETSGKVKLSLTNIFYANDILYLQLLVTNKSNIPYPVHFAKLYIRDDTKSKRTSIMEKEITPRLVSQGNDGVIPAHEDHVIVIAIDRTTLSRNKHLALELFEQNGDRSLTIRIKGRHLLNATNLH